MLVRPDYFDIHDASICMEFSFRPFVLGALRVSNDKPLWCVGVGKGWTGGWIRMVSKRDSTSLSDAFKTSNMQHKLNHCFHVCRLGSSKISLIIRCFA